MMKRNFLAVVIPALLAAGAANAAEVYNKDGNKLDLYGKVVGLHYFSDDSDNDGDKTYARLGFKGETQITNELTGYGRFEYEFNASGAENQNASASKTRYAYAGFKFADYGSFDYGRNLGIAYDGISYTDVLPEFGSDSQYTDSITGRSSGVATYRNKNFFGLVDGWDFAVQYQGKNEGSRVVERQNGDGWGVSSSYTSPIGVGVIGSYETVDRTTDQSDDGHGDRAEAWATGLKYDANSVYLAATYGEYRNLTYIGNGLTAFTSTADKTKVFEAVAQYTFDFGLTPSLGYVSAKAKDDSNGNNDYVSKYVSLGANYAFNKNMSVYTEYDINLLDNDNAYRVANDDRVALGVVYQF
ncbi:porin [Lonsdalea britannica]|uniref:Porin n=1 Tax=Lonsdalea britannica TaxID=1082704 RepID=A0AAD0SGX7_9GAMM|nr:porin [Lonsdalea britannica]AXW87687.1 porin [Lonsdalea britannica]OSM98248.1 porin [Lonsdalea britannica]OSN09468.1 porin [Lonsdalea britannica]